MPDLTPPEDDATPNMHLPEGASIIKFGRLFEENGCIHCTEFTFDSVYSEKPADEVIIILLIKRFTDELKEIQARRRATGIQISSDHSGEQ